MGFNRFYFHIVLRVILIVSTAVFLAFFITQDDKIMASLISSALIFVQTIFLIKYINKTNKNLAAFLLRLHSKDTAVNYYDEQSLKSFKGLNISFQQINDAIQRVEIENEQKTHYINSIVSNLCVGVLAFDDNGKVELMNEAACKIFDSPRIFSLDRLKEAHFDIYQALEEAKGQNEFLKKINSKNGMLSLAFRSSQIKIGDRSIHILSFLNIRNELDHNELDSWQKLIRVLNHEIMNSITPITTLSKTIYKFMHRGNKLKQAKELNDEMIKDIALNTQIITERGKSLIDFVEVYKELTQAPKLNISEFQLAALVKRVFDFFQSQNASKNISFLLKNDESILLRADPALIEQMLINLIKNALEATKTIIGPVISVELGSAQQAFVKIRDNGLGIAEEEMDKIFIPFYTTKENGSGIGLSLSRQIMRLHNGKITVVSKKGEGSTFTLEF
jgi:signal transduction histidine kinase